MTRAWFQSTFFRLLLGVLALVVTILVPLAYVALDAYRSSLEKHYQEQVQSVAAGLSAAAFNAVAARDFPSLQGIAAEIARNTGADMAVIVDDKGKIWAHSDPTQAGESYVAEEYPDYTLSEPVPVRVGDRTLATAVAGISRTRLEEEVQRPQLALGLVFVFALLVAAGLAVLISSRTARPVRQLTEVARAIGAGRLDVPVGEIGGPGEVREMARVFEEMRQSLQNNVCRLEESYRELDRKVHDISILYSVSEAMNTGDYSEGTLDTVVGESHAGVKGLFAAVWVAGEKEEEEPRLVASRGIDRRHPSDAHFRISQMVTQLAQERGASVRQEIKTPDEEHPDAPEQSVFVYALPLQLAARIGGALVVARLQPFAREDLELLEALASQAARCVERARLYAASITDGLTGLYVSRYFRLRIKDELRAAARYQHSLSLLMVDIDHFKRVNDTYGHQAGDHVLRVVARCILETIRDGIDLGARYGGEEFAILLPETSRDGARVLAERLRALIEKQLIHAGGQSIRVTASIGVATSPECGLRPEAVVEAADKALYEAKRSGRNRVITA